MLNTLKYPIGKLKIPAEITTETLEEWIQILQDFPDKLEALVINLTEEQLDFCYRKNGWSIRQVVHHCYDSHQNSYTRFKWALTEDQPLIKAYFEERWAELADSKNGPIQLSINALKALHAKWVYFLKGLSRSDLQKNFIHPEGNEVISLAVNVGFYAWHCNHHYAHIYNLLQSKNLI